MLAVPGEPPDRSTSADGPSFLNDVPLDPDAVTLAKVLRAHGYQTAYIGKWHLNGGNRSAFIPKNRRQGFEYWKAMECTHNYSNSWYYAGDSRVKKKWDGYDAFAQTKDAEQYLRDHAEDSKPFLLMLSWGPPHQPYRMAPSSYLQLYNKATLKLRPNVPPSAQARTRRYLAGYYAQCSALDHCVGEIWRALKENDLEARTILVFTSDHGDMLGSQGEYRKQRPWDESIRVPLLFHYPDGFGKQGRPLDALINSQDLMPTLLGLCHVAISSTVEGLDYSGYMAGGKDPSDGAALITCPFPFGNWDRANGGREYRGIRTHQYTYVRTLRGPWLLYDDLHDPYQLHNLCGQPEDLDQQAKLDAILQNKLKAAHDQFLPGTNYIHQWGYKVDANGNVRY